MIVIENQTPVVLPSFDGLLRRLAMATNDDRASGREPSIDSRALLLVADVERRRSRRAPARPSVAQAPPFLRDGSA